MLRFISGLRPKRIHLAVEYLCEQTRSPSIKRDVMSDLKNQIKRTCHKGRRDESVQHLIPKTIPNNCSSVHVNDTSSGPQNTIQKFFRTPPPPLETSLRRIRFGDSDTRPEQKKDRTNKKHGSCWQKFIGAKRRCSGKETSGRCISTADVTRFSSFLL